MVTGDRQPVNVVIMVKEPGADDHQAVGNILLAGFI